MSPANRLPTCHTLDHHTFNNLEGWGPVKALRRKALVTSLAGMLGVDIPDGWPVALAVPSVKPPQPKGIGDSSCVVFALSMRS